MAGTRPPTWTEPTIETAIDTLANLTSVQGRTITLADANLDVLWGWDDSAGAYDNFALADITTEASPAAGDFILIYGAEGDLRKSNWNTLPSGSGISNVVEDTSPELGGDLESNNFDIIMEQFSADAVDAEILFSKSRNAAIGSHTVVQSGDDLGRIVFRGSDGTNFEEAAYILAEVDTTPGNNDMPGRLSFWTTPDASATPVERIQITSSTTTQVNIVNADAGTTGPLLQFQHNSASPASGDEVGQINFLMNDSGGNATTWARINAVAADVTNGAEYGSINFNIMVNGVDFNVMEFEQGHFNFYSPHAFGTFEFQDLNNDGQAGVISVYTNSASPADGDDVGYFTFRGNDSTAVKTSFVTLIGRSEDVTNGTEDGAFAINTMDGGADTEQFRIHSSGTVSLANNMLVTNWGGTSTTPQTTLEVWYNDGSDNTIARPFMLTRTAATTMGVGIGVGMTFRCETATGENFELVGSIDALSTDVSAGTEDFDFVFNLMAAGAAFAEKFRIKSTGTLVSPTGQVAHFWVYWTANSTTILASHNMTSIDDDAVGDAGVNIGTDFSSNNYAAFVQTNDTTNGWDAEEVQASGINVHTAGVVDVLCSTITDGTTAATSLTDPDQWQVVGFGVSA